MSTPFRLFTSRLPQHLTRRSTTSRFSASPKSALPKTWRRFASESGPRPKPGQSPFKIWPFVAIVAAGSGAYVLMVRQRADMPAYQKPDNQGLLAAPHKNSPTYSPNNVTVLFVLGGPGAGKGTQCANLVRDYGFTHLSAGDLLRAEQDRPNSQFGQLIKDYIKDGKIVPMEVTVQLLENAMTDAIRSSPPLPAGKKSKFLIDGFPRKMDQAVKFEDTVCKAKGVLFFDCPEEEMQKRLLKRGETSGRADDNMESIKKRFKTFVETSMPVVDYFEKQGKVTRVLATKTPDEVYKDTKNQLEGKIGKDLQ